MLYTIPVSHADHALLPVQAALLKSLGKNPGHHLLVVATQDVEATDVAAFKKEVGELFDSVDSAVVQVKRGWPLGSNQLFRECAKLAAQRGMPWMFGELDSAPLRRGWLEELSQEYIQSGKRFSGAVVPTRGFVGGEPVTDGEHMVGFGIYPADFAQRSVRLPTIDVVMMWAPGHRLIPFDIELRYETTPFAHRSKLIQHNLRTINYRLDDKGQIVCDNHPDNPETANHAKPVSATAVVVHGVKDDSLAKLVMAGVKSKTVEVTQPEATVAVAVPSTQEGGPAPDAPPMEVNKPSYRAFQIHAKLKEGKGYRVPAMATTLGWSEDDVRAVIAEPTSGLEVLKLGWVKMKTAAA